MIKDIKDVFKIHLKNIKIDKSLIHQLEVFRLEWVNKNNDHIEFLGGNLLGVNPIRFSILDEEKFFIDILNIDKDSLKRDIDNVRDINPKWIISSNPMYQTIGYLMHLTIHSKLGTKDKNHMLELLYLIMGYKMMSSLVSHYFKFDVKKEIAVAVYERLSMKFLIKKLATWQEYFIYRAKDVEIKNGLHYKKLVRYNTKDSIEVLNDLQNRLRDMVKNIYLVLLDVKDGDDVAVTTSLSGKLSDDSISGILNRPDMYLKYMHNVIPKENDLIKNELLQIVDSMINNINTVQLSQVLKYLSVHSLIDKQITNDIDEILKLSIEYLTKKNRLGEYESNIENTLIHLRGFWSASKIKDNKVKEIKERMQKHTKLALNKNTKWLLVTTSAGVFIYIYLRAISKNIYK